MVDGNIPLLVEGDEKVEQWGDLELLSPEEE